MRADKNFTIITVPKRQAPVIYYHCAEHGARMIRLPDGLRCPTCGGVDIATKKVIAT